jgi:lysophospholipase L1-like esterase
MIKPKHTLGFLLIVLLLLAIVALVFPKDNVKIAGIEIKFRTIQDILHPEKVQYADISEIVEKHLTLDTIVAAPIDTIALEDTVRADAELLAASEYPIQLTEEGKTKLYGFFKDMENARNDSQAVHIMHYGDSQIEADHITSFLRERLQQSFGGNGPGLLAVKPVTQKLSWRVKPGDTWKRYTLFGKKDSTIMHKRFGPAMALFRYAPVWNDSIPNDTLEYSASFVVKNSFQGYPTSNKWTKSRFFYGNLHSDMTVSVKDKEGEILMEDSLPPVEKLSEIQLTEMSDEFTVELKGYDSPDVYAMSLESDNGIIVDNIPLRGSAGTVFTTIEYSMLRNWFETLNTELLILEFGVNVVSDKVEDFTYYENWMYYQLDAIKRMEPEMAVIVVGVSDMSKKDGTQYVSYDAIEKIRDAQKNATIRAGFTFWDMYEAMGGENSMPSWVWAEPPLANQDYTHFNVQGSKIIGNMFYNALMLEYKNYRQSMKKEKKEEVVDEMDL